MCSVSKSKPYRFNSEMEYKSCSKLLELAATDDLAGFIHQVEERGSDIDQTNYWYGRSFGSKKMGFEERTPIMLASLYGSIEVLNYILATGKVDVNRPCGSDRATPLHCAAAGGSWSSVEVVKLLIDASGDTNAIDANCKKPVALIAGCVKASSNSKRRTLEMLLNGLKVVPGDHQEDVEECKKTSEMCEKKDYPVVDIPLPDINNGIYGSDEFRMYSFKVKPCSRAYSHDWTECPFAHPGENAKRRDLMKYQYTCVPCPEFKKGSCAKGDACEYAHGVFESWLHPAQYKTRLCKDEIGCSRKVCFFAHKPEELRPLYTSTGSALPSPKSASLDSTGLSPLSLGCSTPPMSTSVACSSPMWQNRMNLTPPALQLPGSRLKTTLTARDLKLDMELLGLEKIRTQQQQKRLVEEMAGLSSSSYRDLNPTNLDDVFGSLDPSLQSHLHGLSPKPNSSPRLQSPNAVHIRQSTNQLRASYPLNMSPSPARNHGFDSSAAVAAAVMNSRSSAFAKRSQSFIDRNGPSYRSGLMDPHNSPGRVQSDWGSPNGKLDWGFNGEEANKLRKSASFGFRSGGSAMPAVAAYADDEPDVSWVNALVKDVPTGGPGMYSTEQKRGGGHDVVVMMPRWVDQMYIEQEQMVA